MADKHSTSEQPASGRPIRVLVVDDHPVVRDGLRAMLDAPGIAVVGEASSGAIAVQRVDELQPDVILMDVRMPDMDGLTATRLIKASFTFAGGADYLVWKIARHTGHKITLTAWQRRHPVIAGLILLPRLLRRGTVK